jgi:hypothetical protein
MQTNQFRLAELIAGGYAALVFNIARPNRSIHLAVEQVENVRAGPRQLRTP